MKSRYAVRGCSLAAVGLALAGCVGGQAAAPTNPVVASPTPAAVASAPSLEGSPSPDSAPACDGRPTLAQTEGPYYKPGSPERSSLVEAGTVGERLILTGAVLTSSCQPLEGVVVDVWQADGVGVYDNQGFGLRGRVRTDAAGSYTMETVVPGAYPGRTPHIHVKVFAPDGRELLTTQIYLAGLSEQIPDAIFSEELLAKDLPPDPEGRRQIEFDIVVSG